MKALYLFLIGYFELLTVPNVPDSTSSKPFLNVVHGVSVLYTYVAVNLEWRLGILKMK